ncbi:hypothetical protein CEUSTIGMA_g9920.t1 [Chlamydomonas eustigma]|uniref:Peptidase M24 domain-containing protein n=1 Tax=Chlamydomonas eustigma TaxID=1157962 RepID=A0A250XHG7_9CHLO|nr:hypothetical protein CEUSTIGMA_g9920.t1 [Chlamydomonas eustigma]|eukprot:GAX82493.1 hypothetical protein CEUSTIGMA_g9920.t1 [Chlamydomonas eustigma]
MTMSETDSQTGDKAELDLSNSDVVTKYKAAAEIANKAVAGVIAACKDGAKIVDLCVCGDSIINLEVEKIFKGKKLEKGSAFPTCVSVNSVVGHFSPVSEDTTSVKNGDLVKIDLGVHIDGFIATQAQTIFIQEDAAAPVTGRAADVMSAARIAFDAALRLIRPGKKVSEVAATLQTIAEAHGCNIVEGVMTHQMKQFIIDGNKCVLNRPSPEAKVEDAEFEENEVYAVDIVMSTGDGKPKVLDEKATTVYKRALDVEYNLKLKASRAVFSEVNKRYPTMPFTLRALVEGVDNKDLAKQMRLGMVECLNHQMLQPYPVLHEKPGDLVSQVKGTVLLMPNGSDVVTKAPSQTIETVRKVADVSVLELLSASIKTNKKKKKKAEVTAPAHTSALPRHNMFKTFSVNMLRSDLKFKDAIKMTFRAMRGS